MSTIIPVVCTASSSSMNTLKPPDTAASCLTMGGVGLALRPVAAGMVLSMDGMVRRGGWRFRGAAELEPDPPRGGQNGLPGCKGLGLSTSGLRAGVACAT